MCECFRQSVKLIATPLWPIYNHGSFVVLEN